MRCPSCGGVIGRDCFNPQECAQITQNMQKAELDELTIRALKDAKECIEWFMKLVEDIEISALTGNKMYNYQTEKSAIFTENGQEAFLKIRDKVKQALKQSGAVMMQNAINGVTGDTWLHLACVDRLVELKEIREVTNSDVAGQHRVFVSMS